MKLRRLMQLPVEGKAYQRAALCVTAKLAAKCSDGSFASDRQAGGQTKLDRVLGDAENNRDRRSCSFGCKRNRCLGGRGDQRHATTNQIGHERRQLIVFPFQPVVLDPHNSAHVHPNTLAVVATPSGDASARPPAGCALAREPLRRAV